MPLHLDGAKQSLEKNHIALEMELKLTLNPPWRHERIPEEGQKLLK